MPERFASSNQDAADRYARFSTRDPYPDIKPALLNSADISDYVAATGMVWPYYEDQDRLKPASYEVALLGECVFWDDVGIRQQDTINPGDSFELQPNSIAFVTLEPHLRLPQYIAVRFNLRISHIYKGILLGTGPLVDPGFEGRLSIPLHNLTTNTYELVGGRASSGWSSPN